jgi:hypothetical protein
MMFEKHSLKVDGYTAIAPKELQSKLHLSCCYSQFFVLLSGLQSCSMLNSIYAYTYVSFARMP